MPLRTSARGFDSLEAKDFFFADDKRGCSGSSFPSDGKAGGVRPGSSQRVSGIRTLHSMLPAESGVVNDGSLRRSRSMSPSAVKDRVYLSIPSRGCVGVLIWKTSTSDGMLTCIAQNRRVRNKAPAKPSIFI